MLLNLNASNFCKWILALLMVTQLMVGRAAAQTYFGGTPPKKTLSKPDSLKALALNNLRTFRAEVIKQQKNSTRDSLFSNVAYLITLVPMMDDAGQIDFVNKYFDHAQHALQTNEAAVQIKVMKVVNRDLTLKLKRRDTLIKGLEPSNQLSASKKIMVHIYVNGVETKSGNYRLYWTAFTGADFDIESIIKKNEFIDSSDDFSNPCGLSVRLPGLITIWMEDTATHKKYKPDLLYKEMDADYKGLDIHFSLIP